MRKFIRFCVPLLLAFGVLISPATFAADKTEITGMELFNPLDLEGFPAPQIGEFLVMPTIACPGFEPTGDPMQPCPVGSRTHIRGGLIVSRINSDDARVAGWMTVELNANLDANFEGVAWGTFSIAVDAGGTWEGTWQGPREVADLGWTATLNVRARGYGGAVDGLKLMAVDQLYIPTPLPLAYIGEIEGRIIDPN